jgi:hypothetical protein
MVEFREVLRLWCRRHGLRTVASRTGVDRKTVRRYVEAARKAGLEPGATRVEDGLIAEVEAAVRSGASPEIGSIREHFRAHEETIRQSRARWRRPLGPDGCGAGEGAGRACHRTARASSIVAGRAGGPPFRCRVPRRRREWCGLVPRGSSGADRPARIVRRGSSGADRPTRLVPRGWSCGDRPARMCRARLALDPPAGVVLRGWSRAAGPAGIVLRGCVAPDSRSIRPPVSACDGARAPCAVARVRVRPAQPVAAKLACSSAARS